MRAVKVGVRGTGFLILTAFGFWDKKGGINRETSEKAGAKEKTGSREA
jgi:hypothetical protein